MPPDTTPDNPNSLTHGLRRSDHANLSLDRVSKEKTAGGKERSSRSNEGDLGIGESAKTQKLLPQVELPVDEPTSLPAKTVQSIDTASSYLTAGIELVYHGIEKGAVLLKAAGDALKERQLAAQREKEELEAKQELAKLAEKHNAERGKTKETQKKKLDAFEEAEEKRQSSEFEALKRKYPYLKDFGWREEGQFVRDNFPLLNYSTYRARRAQARYDAKDWWYGYDCAECLRAGNEVDSQREEQWKDLKRRAAKDSEDGNKCKLFLAHVMWSDGYPLRGGGVNSSGLKSGTDYGTSWQELATRTLVEFAEPGTGARDLTAYLLRTSLTAQLIKPKFQDSGLVILNGIKRLADPDKGASEAPISKDSLRFIERQALIAEVRDEKKNRSDAFEQTLADDLRGYRDREAIYWLRLMHEWTPYQGAKDKLAQALSDIPERPKELWHEIIPNPLLSAEERSANLAKALETQSNRPSRVMDDCYIGEPVAEAIAVNYKMYNISDAKDPGLPHLKDCLEKGYLPVRLAAARVLADSDLPLDNPVKSKALEVAVTALLDRETGPAARQDALAIADLALRGRGSAELDKFIIAKEDDGLVIYQKASRYVVSNDGNVQYCFRPGKPECTGSAGSINTADNTTTINYPSGSSITKRIATMDGDTLKQVSWYEAGKTRPTVATHKMVDGKYVNKWVIRIPNEATGLSDEVDVEGTFAVKNGLFTYVGQDWRQQIGPRRTLHQYQAVNAKGVSDYHD